MEQAELPTRVGEAPGEAALKRCRRSLPRGIPASRCGRNAHREHLGEPGGMKQHIRVAVIGGGVTGCSVLYHLAKAGVDRRGPLRAIRADLGLLVACRRRYQRLRRRRQHGIPAEVQLRALPVPRGRERAVLRLPPHRRAHPRPHAGASRGADRAQGEDASPWPRSGVPDPRKSTRQGAHSRSRPDRRRALGAEPGPCRPERGDPRLRPGGPKPGGRDPPAVSGGRDQPAPGRRLGGGHRPGDLPGRARGQCGRAVGPGSGGARGHLPAPDAGRAPLLRDREHPGESRRWSAKCPPSATPTRASTCARRARDCSWAPTKASAPTGRRRGLRRTSATSCSRTTSIAWSTTSRRWSRSSPCSAARASSGSSTGR